MQKLTGDKEVKSEQSLAIRAASIEDCEALTELMNLPGVRYGTLRTPFQSLAQTRQWFDGLAPNYLNLVALVEGQIVGHAELQPCEGRRSHCAVLEIAVRDDNWGRGIGAALMSAVIDTADNWLNIRRLELRVFTDNIAAIHLYKKLGFETEGTLQECAFRNGGFSDAYTMARIRPV